jgi:intracellular sulfur oxidation DsrE/DsrF family protein
VGLRSRYDGVAGRPAFRVALTPAPGRLLGPILALTCWLLPAVAGSQVLQYQVEAPHVADIQVHTASELAGLMERADEVFADAGLNGAPPVSFVLHGEEARVFMRSSYSQHKMLVDLAASLTALGVVEIRVCETWMGNQALDPAGLQPFVGTVPNGMLEVRRLREEEGYLDF